MFRCVYILDILKGEYIVLNYFFSKPILTTEVVVKGQQWVTSWYLVIWE